MSILEIEFMDGKKLELEIEETAPARMVRATPTLYSMGHVAEQLGRWATRNSSLTRSQRKAGQALELLGLELLAKQAEDRGAEKAGRG